jgi:long-subunit fatty acid transport protein
MRKLILSLFVSVIIGSGSFVQGQTTYNFLRLDVDARSASLAGSFVSMTNDINGIFYNPSSLTTLESPRASVGFFKYLMDINSGNAAFGLKYKNLGYFGVGIRYINYGTFDKYDENYVNVGTFSANDFAINLSYANIYLDHISYGISFKFITSKYDEYSSSAIAGDFGLLYNIPQIDLSLGVSFLNLGYQISNYINTRENLPSDLRIGLSKKLEHLPLTVHIGFSRLNDETDKFFQRFKNVIVGGEFNLSENFDLRLGYNNQIRQDLKTGTTLGLSGFSAGLGFKYDRYSLDYSYNSLGKIGATHRFNIGYIWK